MRISAINQLVKTDLKSGIMSPASEMQTEHISVNT